MTRFLVVAEQKASPPPFGGSAKPFGTKPQGGADAMPALPDPTQDDPALQEQEPQDVATHEWSGDLIDPAVETPSDPTVSFASFTGTQGETAWLDRADDGTLTGWVQDADGSIYRYSDVDAWAVDVDDAGMIRGDATDPAAEDPAAADQPPVDEQAMAVEDGSAAAGGSTTPNFMEGKQVALRAVVLPKALI